MTTEALKQQLLKSVLELREIASSLSFLPSSSLASSCQDRIRNFSLIADQLSTILDLITARQYAQELLQQLPSKVDLITDFVDYHEVSIPFYLARLLAFQSYLSITWAVCDSITTAIAPLICTRKTIENRSNPPQLLTHFVKGDDSSPYHSSFFLVTGYGWPIGVSYVLRNHFVHDGAIHFGKDFFEGRSAAHGFRISEDGWKFLEEQLNNKHRLNNGQTRVSASWPWYQDNLLQLLELCNDEMDDALSCLVGWSVGMTKIQAQLLLQRDLTAISPTSFS